MRPRNIGLRTVRRSAIVALVLGATGALFAVGAAPAAAVGTDWYVATSGSNSNDCLSAAHPCHDIGYVVENHADNDDVVHVAGGKYAESSIVITKNLTIVGAPDGTTSVGDTSDEAIFAVLGDVAAPTVTFENLSIEGNSGGVGVFAETASLRFRDTRVSDNYWGGVVADETAIQAWNSSFSSNGHTARDIPTGDGVLLGRGAVVANGTTFDGNLGAGIDVDGSGILLSGIRADAAGGFAASVRLDHSTASHNKSGGLLGEGASVQLWSSTLSGNTGFGLGNDNGVAVVRNSTITGTQPRPAVAPTLVTLVPNAGILTDGAEVVGTAPTQLRRASVARAQKAFPQGVAKPTAKVRSVVASVTAPGELDPGEAAVSSSIVAEQAKGVADCAVSIKFVVDDGYNLSSDSANSCGFSGDSNDLVKTDPLLGPLADNGGPTWTHLLEKGSPAIDYVPNGKVGCVTTGPTATDQRYRPRVQPIGGKCDIGAVELAATALAIHPNTLPHGTVGRQYSQQLTATGGQYPTYTFAFAGGHLPPGLSLAPDGRISGKPTRAGTFEFTVSVNDPVFKDYTIVIEEPAAPNDNGEEPISDTGARVGGLSVLGAGCVTAGFALLLAAGGVGRRARHRRS
jgi:hypothetical protein